MTYNGNRKLFVSQTITVIRGLKVKFSVDEVTDLPLHKYPVIYLNKYQCILTYCVKSTI